MKYVLILCVTYHSDEELQGYVQSVDAAASLVAGECKVDVFVADNAASRSPEQGSDYAALRTYRTFPFPENLGYLGAAGRMLSEVEDVAQYDYVAISNVDLYMPQDFFQKLLQVSLPARVGWLATSILSSLEGRDRNPKILCRYTRRKLYLLRFLFKYGWLHALYVNTLYRRKSKRRSLPAMPVYAGHGSFMLFTREFISHYPAIDYPVFLFGEEIFLAELCRQAHLQVFYEPALVIHDTEHCSTGKMRRKSYYQYNYDAISYILKVFY